MTVERYLARAPEPHRSTLIAVRTVLRELLPEASESIAYRVPAFKVDGRAVAGYAHFKNHNSYFPHSETVLPSLADELDRYDWSKGTLRFPIDEPLPKDLLASLVGVRLDELGFSRP